QVRVLSATLAAEQEHVRAVSATLAAEQERVRVLSVTVEQINHQVLERDQAIQTLFSHVAASQEHERALSEELARRDSELARIKGSRGWRLLESYGRIKYRRLLPIYRLLGLMTKGASEHSGPAVEDAANSIALVTANFGGIDEVKAL